MLLGWLTRRDPTGRCSEWAVRAVRSRRNRCRRRSRRRRRTRPSVGSANPGGLSLSARPRPASLTLTSSIDFEPKLRMSSRSASLRPTSSPTVWMPSRLRQLYDRTVRSRSSIGIENAAMSATSAGDGPTSMPSASSLSSRNSPNSSTRVCPATGHRVARGDRGLGLDVDHEPVEVGALLDAGGLDVVGHLEHRRVDRVDRDAADLLAGLLVLHGGDVTAATLDDQLDLEPALLVDRGDVQVGVVDGRRRPAARCRRR